MSVQSVQCPWYRHAWVWFIISFPLAAVLGGFATWYLAWQSDDGLVVTDYYKRGLEINQSLATRDTARMLGLQAEMLWKDGRLSLQMQSSRELSWPDELTLDVMNATRASADQHVRMFRNGGLYLAELGETLPAGRWNLLLSDFGQTWQLHARVVLPSEAEIRFEP
ncbi:MAG: hypothetical protein BSR46_09480 [Candidatus Dactylopiibacterium carminicum]|nr:MAG: hypothetical protein BSR46_09480 [Candidatus Dactylopiibacterium carminicum]